MTPCQHLSTIPILLFTLLTTLTVTIATPTSLSAAEVINEKPLPREDIADRCQELLRQKQKMAEDQKAENTELHERVALLNRAPEDKKITLISELLARLVEQNAVAAQRTEKMQKMMSAHLMKHLQLATPNLAACPVLKDSTDMKDLKDMQDTKSPNNEIAK